MLTLEELEKMGECSIIGSGVVDNPGLHKHPVRWVAVRGMAPDWAIYFHHAVMSVEEVMREGDKIVFYKDLIRELVPCTDEVFARYRY